jgi:hypothetical protein
MKKFSDYIKEAEVVNEAKISKDKLTQIIGNLYNDLSSTFFGIKAIESEDFNDEVKKIKSDLQSLIGDVSNLFYKKLKNK